MSFTLQSDYAPSGDQRQAIDKLVKSLQTGNNHQCLLGVTGSGKTFTMANVVSELNRPTLVMSHNKTLAAQLYSEFRNFFPNNAVEYFVSYFDYYQPEAYIPRSDTYIEKDSSINDEIERLRLATMGSLLTRRDVLVVASVSCIYGLGSPEDYQNMTIPIHKDKMMERDTLLEKLVDMLYERNDIEFSRGKFRVRGDVVEVYPAYLDNEGVRVEFFGDQIERISVIDPLTGQRKSTLESCTFFPAKQFVTPAGKMKRAIQAIRKELDSRVDTFENTEKYIEAQRIRQRTEYDIEMMREMGFCQGIENYSRHLANRAPGSRPGTLLDFFPEDFLLIMDESHATIPQVEGMYEGDRSRKTTLVEHGFRLPSALDNRPLRFEEFMEITGQRLYVSATPAPFEIENSTANRKGYLPRRKLEPGQRKPDIMAHCSRTDEPVEEFDVTTPGAPLIVEQIIRPTGLLDPVVTVCPLKDQIDETIELCRQRIEKNERVLITTLTKRTAEDLTDYLVNLDLKVRYMHSDIDAVERVEILRSLRNAEFDILVGINLLREGLDLPEVSLVCILDADKEGYLRSETSLIQTAGRAARHEHGEVVLFADVITGSIRKLIEITNYRRERQIAHNKEHGIEPQSVVRAVQESLHMTLAGDSGNVNRSVVAETGEDLDVLEVLAELETEMHDAASRLEFERAALLRDQIEELKSRSHAESSTGTGSRKRKKSAREKKKIRY